MPKTGSLVYTVWDRIGALVYVGMAGRSGAVSSKGKGPYGRLESHASGRRSGDQFCIYVCDRFVLPRVHNQIAEIAAGTLSLDALTRDFIRTELSFRFAPVAGPAEAYALERRLQRGEWPAGSPTFNAILTASRR